MKLDNLILALDVDSFKLAKRFLDILFPLIKIFKVGPQLFIPYGERIIRFIKEKGGRVFLDLKFFDIPNTVANSCRQVVCLNIDMFSLHIQGGSEMLEAAVEATKEEAKIRNITRPLILGVTVLTSLNQEIKIKEFSVIVKKTKLDGIICPAKDAELFRKNLGKRYLIASPGIRLKSFPSDDQKKISTPKEAILAGADYLIVGRPILEAKDPLKVTKEILREIYGAKRGN